MATRTAYRSDFNVILGTNDGEFTLTACYTAKNGKRKLSTLARPADSPEKVLRLLQMLVKRHGKINAFMTSSSIDFPEEYGVTRKQVDALLKELEVGK